MAVCGPGDSGLGGCVNRSGALRAEELNAAVREVLVGFPPPQGTFGVPVRPPSPKSDLQIIEASWPPSEWSLIYYVACRELQLRRWRPDGFGVVS